MIFGLNFTFLSKYWFYYMDGLKVTLQLAFWTLILSSIVGVIMGMIRVQNYKIISTIIDWWINFIRGVPIMVQIFIHCVLRDRNVASTVLGGSCIFDSQ